MAGKFTLYLKLKGGSDDSAKKAATWLNSYLPEISKKSKAFESYEAVLVDGKTTPTLLETDAIVYIVSSVRSSVIAANGGDLGVVASDTGFLGLTDLNANICEVYFDRMYEGSPKELSGACYHEMAHIKSNMDDSMHKDQNGFLKAGPDYNGSPTEKNNEFVAKHIGRKLRMRSGL